MNSQASSQKTQITSPSVANSRQSAISKKHTESSWGKRVSQPDTYEPYYKKSAQVKTNKRMAPAGDMSGAAGVKMDALTNPRKRCNIKIDTGVGVASEAKIQQQISAETVNYFAGEGLNNVFKNENVKIDRQVPKKINQVDDINGATPTNLHKKKKSNDSGALAHLYTKGVNMSATHRTNMNFGKSSAEGVITGTTKGNYKDEIKNRGISIKTHEMTRSTFDHDNYYTSGQDWHKYPRNVAEKSPIEGSTPKRFYKPLKDRLNMNLNTQDILTPKAGKSWTMTGDSNPIMPTTANDYNKYFSADKPQEENLRVSQQFSGKRTQESDTSMSSKAGLRAGNNKTFKSTGVSGALFHAY